MKHILLQKNEQEVGEFYMNHDGLQTIKPCEELDGAINMSQR